ENRPVAAKAEGGHEDAAFKGREKTVCPVCGTNHESLQVGIGELLYGDKVSLEPKHLLRAGRRRSK
ncbi:MAG TPA: hypothetical protein GX507_11670, partial [Clostridia bacterium]|nr:hypothetical protein [Clostridia bacterium]